MAFTKGHARYGGRVKGLPNKATAEIKDLAREHGPAALKRLVHLMKNAENEQTQAFAAEKVLDRAYGKSVQTNENFNHTEVSQLSDNELRRLLTEHVLAGRIETGVPKEANGSGKPH